jgi:Reverse transcriptase (RNA-dependent DNA polymerase)
LEEEVYREAPPGVVFQGAKVCRLKKALYGLKQSPRGWFGNFYFAMKNYGFNQGDSDHKLFFKRDHDKLTVLIIYVDDYSKILR